MQHSRNMPNQDKRESLKSQVSKQTVRRLLSYISSRYKVVFIVVFVCIIFSALAGVAGSLFLEILVDDYILPMIDAANPDFSNLFRALVLMSGIYIVGIISTYFYNRLMAIISQGVQKDIRDELFSHMQKLPIRYFDTHSYGQVMSHYTNDIDTLRQMLGQSLPQVISSILTAVFVLAAMIYTSIPLTILMLVLVMLMLRISRSVTNKSSRFFRRQQEDLGTLNGYIEEMINGQKVVKIFNYEDEAEVRFIEKNDQLFDSGSKANIYANLLGPITNNLGNLSYVIIGLVGGVLATNAVIGLTLGGIISFLQLTRSFNGPINQVNQQLSMIVMGLAGAERIFNLMDEEVETDDGEVTLVNVKYDRNNRLVKTTERTGIWAWEDRDPEGHATLTHLTGDVRLNGVDFSYDGKKSVLHNVSLYAKPGQKIAFVGATGAGKTTITNLINRFYDISDGTVLYDGIDIKKIRKADLRRSLGIVLQDTNLFTATVMENIRYGKLGASDDEVLAAAKLAGADSFITRLPEGYQTVLTGDGSGLSQGQRQLLSIARAAIADPPVMILDEATSSIDTRTEAYVQKGMDALMHGRTVFVIAHRLSTVQNAKAIIVLEEGRIIERGDHDELIEKKGRYYQLYTGSFESADDMLEQASAG